MLDLDPKQKAIFEFCGAQVRLVQTLNDLDVPEKEILKVLCVKPRSIKHMIEMFNIGKNLK